jgi:hypothetical protein
MRDLREIQTDAADAVTLGRVTSAVLTYCATVVDTADTADPALEKVRELLVNGNPQRYAVAVQRVIAATQSPASLTDEEILQAVTRLMPKLL